MNFVLGDQVITHDRRRGEIAGVTEPPRPYRVAFREGGERWCDAEILMLYCDCDIRFGCQCGASRREREGKNL